MGKRRKAREVALQFLYQLDLNGDDDPSPHGEEFWARHPVDDDTRAFADALVHGAKTNQAK
ncbi:MAG TPA: transcription antitermination factor NusB, partial [Candidatus Binatia bacterium]|nr:transcription antitermination factor NusB [Candidatus Binatia bacterium]